MSHLLFVLSSFISSDRQDFSLPATGPCDALYVVTMRATLDDQIVIYDHWEDGLEPDGDDFFIRAPTQASTLRFVLKAHQTISLFSHADGTPESCLPDTLVPEGEGCGLQGQRCSPAASQPSCEFHCTAALATAFRFDGGDRISTNADLQVSTDLFPPNAPPIALGAASLLALSEAPVTVTLNGPASIDAASGEYVEFDYAISITTQIPLALGRFVLTDTLPAGMAYVAGFDQGTTCTPAPEGPALSCSTSTNVQVPGQTTHLAFRVKADTTNLTRLDNQIEVHATSLLGALLVPSALSNVSSQNVSSPPAATDPGQPPSESPPPTDGQPPSEISPPVATTGTSIGVGTTSGFSSDTSTNGVGVAIAPGAGEETLGGGGIGACNGAGAGDPSTLLFLLLSLPSWFRKSKGEL